jgi:hypothetical protein
MFSSAALILVARPLLLPVEPRGLGFNQALEPAQPAATKRQTGDYAGVCAKRGPKG